MSNLNKNDLVRDLSTTLALLKTSKNIERFLKDLLSRAELVDCPKRWLVSKCLDQGMSFAEIQAKVQVDNKKVGLATIERVKRALEDSEGGFKLALECTERKGRQKGFRARKKKPIPYATGRQGRA